MNEIEQKIQSDSTLETTQASVSLNGKTAIETPIQIPSASIGYYLKCAREKKGVSLEEISLKTKILFTILKELERDNYKALPGKTYLKGFVRSYAKELKISSDEALLLLDKSIKQAENKVRNDSLDNLRHKSYYSNDVLYDPIENELSNQEQIKKRQQSEGVLRTIQADSLGKRSFYKAPLFKQGLKFTLLFILGITIFITPFVYIYKIVRKDLNFRSEKEHQSEKIKLLLEHQQEFHSRTNDMAILKSLPSLLEESFPPFPMNELDDPYTYTMASFLISAKSHGGTFLAENFKLGKEETTENAVKEMAVKGDIKEENRKEEVKEVAAIPSDTSDTYTTTFSLLFDPFITLFNLEKYPLRNQEDLTSYSVDLNSLTILQSPLFHHSKYFLSRTSMSDLENASRSISSTSSTSSSSSSSFSNLNTPPSSTSSTASTSSTSSTSGENAQPVNSLPKTNKYFYKKLPQTQYKYKLPGNDDSSTLPSENENENEGLEKSFPKMKDQSFNQKNFENGTEPIEMSKIGIPTRIKKAFNPEIQNLYIKAMKGVSWITYKKDNLPVQSFPLREGRSIFLQGKEIRLLLGNSNVVEVYHNNKEIVFQKNGDVKGLVFPVASTKKFYSPLFVTLDNGEIMASDEFLDKHPERVDFYKKSATASSLSDSLKDSHVPL